MAEAGLGDGDGEVESGVELVPPVAQEVAFADAVGAAEEHEASEGGALGEVLVGLLNLRVVLLIGFGMVSSKRDCGGSPLVDVEFVGEASTEDGFFEGVMEGFGILLEVVGGVGVVGASGRRGCDR